MTTTDFDARFREYHRILAERIGWINGNFAIYHSESVDRNAIPWGTFCATITMRNNHDTRNYLILTEGTMLSNLPADLIKQYGPFNLWKDSAPKEETLYYFSLIYDDKQNALLSLKNNGYCITRNRMARDWGRKIPAFGLLCEKCGSMCTHHQYLDDDKLRMTCSEDTCMARYIESATPPSGFIFEGYSPLRQKAEVH